MRLLELSFLQQHQRILGALALVIGIGAWAMEFAGTVYVCPYCRVQRTVIAILGVFLLFPTYRSWFIRYLASVIGVLGAVVAVNQNFMGWAKMSKGVFAFSDQIYVDPFLLSGGALFIILGQMWLILSPPDPGGAPGTGG